jgi:hypothetical protein
MWSSGQSCWRYQIFWVVVGVEPRDTLYAQKMALTSPTSSGSSVGIVRLWTKTTEFYW